MLIQTALSSRICTLSKNDLCRIFTNIVMMLAFYGRQTLLSCVDALIQNTLLFSSLRDFSMQIVIKRR